MQLTIEEKIQEGVFTSVYRAFDPVLQRRILLKVLHKHHAADPDLHQRFVREAQACAALRSEYIVQIYTLTEYENCPAIIMEFVEGTSLKQLIADGSTRTLAYTQKVALHTLRGLVAAHEQGIIHRDIKPGNILVATNGIFKISDFGLASLASVPSVTAQGMVLGTPAYMAPEQIRHEEVDQRTDLFALGVTLIEVLTGERIFEGTSYAECAKKILAFRVELLDQYAAYSSIEFVQFLKLLMAPKKQNRFATSKEALAALDKKDSTIFIDISHRYTSSPKSTIALISGIIVFIIAILVLLPSRISDSHHIIPAKVPFTMDSNSVSAPRASSGKHLRDTSIQNMNKQIHKLPVSHPDAVSSERTHQATTDSGTLLLTSTPWATVYVDNKLIGETPLNKPVILAAGKHSVLFVHPSFDPIMQIITVLPFRESTVTGNFFDRVGYLICLATPWAEVYINDQYKDTTPFEKPIMLSPGKYKVRFKNTSFQDVVREVTVHSKDTTSIVVSFKGQR
jgi:serine/threonine protein kinase